MSDLFTMIWPVTDPSIKLPGLVLVAEEDLMLELDRLGVLMTAEPRWSLRDDRLSVAAPVRARAPWDVPPDRAAKAYIADLMPEVAGG